MLGPKQDCGVRGRPGITEPSRAPLGMLAQGEFMIILTARDRATRTVVLEASSFPVRNITST
eukprot:4163246-Pyramimonas_sp.AAC.1